ncbi:hypothetical protein Tco_0429847, partial [Tanacetum coccineum]
MKWYDVEEAEKSTISTQSTLNTLEIVLKYLPRERSGHENRETSHHILHCETKSNMDSVLALSQEELEAIILRVNGDDDLEPQQKSMIIQNLMMSRWINTQKKSDPDVDE